ncbi:class I SAM-dependent methyltransferase [Rhodopila sp.]|jgi:hypothetical protein|uniref:class I SAM-dependent methyltransferase n=1 Tax=Rhodopila sp. TaxID=2480087 RepID=UPI002CC1BB65|nr:class I SAM-dependent methyltransferase [Rhodopila sp.]HVZ08748.1 class I SAM-dependent methyltransferase [Rhodopila sp.]
MDHIAVPRCADMPQAVHTIRTVPLDNLRDAGWLESCLLPFLGLNDEMLHEFPRDLYPWCGHGLKSWQYPIQFSHYLVHLSTLGIATYAEVGCRHGGTFIITVEYLKRFGDLRRAAAIDLQDSATLRDYAALQDFDYLVDSSQSPPVLAYLNETMWDLVLIDGDHSLSGCLHDYAAVKNTARRIALHDIGNDACGGVVQVWKLIEGVMPANRLFTRLDQYSDVNDRTGRQFLGLGIVDFT